MEQLALTTVKVVVTVVVGMVVVSVVVGMVVTVVMTVVVSVVVEVMAVMMAVMMAVVVVRGMLLINLGHFGVDINMCFGLVSTVVVMMTMMMAVMAVMNWGLGIVCTVTKVRIVDVSVAGLRELGMGVSRNQSGGKAEDSDGDDLGLHFVRGTGIEI